MSSEEELTALSDVVQVEVEKLWLMFPPKGVRMKHQPIRLCGACYGEESCHKIEWQFKTTQFCSEKLISLGEYPNWVVFNK